MKKRLMIAAFLVVGLGSQAIRAAADDLAQGFQNPPDAARMWTWWFWLGDKVDRESITADLEALKAQGISGVTVYSLSGPGVSDRGPNYLGPQWRELFKHTLKEADRLGLGVSTMLCSGWNAGGPWVTPEQAFKRHVASQLLIKGPRHFHGRLPQPSCDPRYYKDVAIQAFRVPAGTKIPTITASSFHHNYPTENAIDNDPSTYWVSNGEKPNEGPTKQRPEWLQLDFGRPETVKRVTIIPRPAYGPRQAELQVSMDGKAFKSIKSLAMDKEQATVIDFDGVSGRFLRLQITATWSPQAENVQVEEFRVGDPLVVDPAGALDLTANCASDGNLSWDVPDGQWMVLRTGSTLAGDVTKWSSPTGVGLEVDPLDPEAMDFQFAKVGKPLAKDAGELAGRVFQSVQIDSWECGAPGWTPRFIEEFRKYRGYDPRPYLPALADMTVGNAEITERFRYDYRRTVGDCVADHYYGRLSALAQSEGLVQQSEAASFDVFAADNLKNLGRCAIPMGEFWQDGSGIQDGQNVNTKQTACATHLYGKRIAAAEAFTSWIHWLDSPATLKPTADRAFCEGLNHFFIFSSATRSGEGIPGTEFCAGTHFNRKITWWNQARCFTDYVARCSYLLQQGRFVADVLFYNGDGCPNYVPPKHVDPSLGPGYDYDVCNTEVLLTRLAVRDGQIVLPDGMTYRLLVLPDRRDMPLEVLRKLKEFVAAGMTLVGPRPEKDTGLRDYPQCDRKVKDVAAELWGDCNGKEVKEHVFGKGRVLWGVAPREILAQGGVGADFSCMGGHPDAFVDWIHRRAEDADIYFLANRKDRTERVACTFRVNGKLPELWDPATGVMRKAASYALAGGQTSLPLVFAPHGSMFVVFREPAPAAKAEGSNFPELKPVQELAGPWKVRFEPKWGGPESVDFIKLEDWTKRPEAGIRFYSGTAQYRTTFDLPDRLRPLGTRIFLDLGAVRNLAEVRLNGNGLGIVWTAPWRVDITAAAKPAGNILEIRVTNLWPNRLIGDAALPAEQRRTQTNIGFNKDQPLLESGLLGPVRLMTEE